MAETIADQYIRQAKEIVAKQAFYTHQKAQKDLPMYMKYLQKKIKESSAKGKFSLRYKGSQHLIPKLFGGRWNKPLVRLKDIILQEAENIAREDIEINKAMGSYGATLIKDGNIDSGAHGTCDFRRRWRGSWHGLCARRAPTIKRWSLDARSGDHTSRLADYVSG